MEQYNHWSQKSHDKSLKELRQYMNKTYCELDQIKEQRLIVMRNSLVIGFVLMLGIWIGVCI